MQYVIILRGQEAALLTWLKKARRARIDRAVDRAIRGRVGEIVRDEVARQLQFEQLGPLIRDQIETTVIENVRVQEEVRKACLLRKTSIDRLYGHEDQKVL